MNGLVFSVLTLITIFNDGSSRTELKGIYYAEYSVDARAVCQQEGKRYLIVGNWEKNVAYRAFSCGI